MVSSVSYTCFPFHCNYSTVILFDGSFVSHHIVCNGKHFYKRVTFGGKLTMGDRVDARKNMGFIFVEVRE